MLVGRVEHVGDLCGKRQVSSSIAKSLTAGDSGADLIINRIRARYVAPRLSSVAGILGPTAGETSTKFG